MTEAEKALKVLEQWKAEHYGTEEWGELGDTVEECMRTLKRDMASKVKNAYDFMGVKMGSCAICGSQVMQFDVFCHECGHRLDFKEPDELEERLKNKLEEERIKISGKNL